MSFVQTREKKIESEVIDNLVSALIRIVASQPPFQNLDAVMKFIFDEIPLCIDSEEVGRRYDFTTH